MLNTNESHQKQGKKASGEANSRDKLQKQPENK